MLVVVDEIYVHEGDCRKNHWNIKDKEIDSNKQNTRRAASESEEKSLEWKKSNA